MVQELTVYSEDVLSAFSAAGAIPPLVALLSSPSVDVQVAAANALFILSANDENMFTIATAGAIPRLVALLSSPSVDVQEAAVGALRVLGVGGDAAIRAAL
jgi:vacuolar protein 8